MWECGSAGVRECGILGKKIQKHVNDSDDNGVDGSISGTLF
jgi:hypothetical protein